MKICVCRHPYNECFTTFCLWKKKKRNVLLFRKKQALNILKISVYKREHSGFNSTIKRIKIPFHRVFAFIPQRIRCFPYGYSTDRSLIYYHQGEASISFCVKIYLSWNSVWDGDRSRETVRPIEPTGDVKRERTASKTRRKGRRKKGKKREIFVGPILLPPDSEFRVNCVSRRKNFPLSFLRLIPGKSEKYRRHNLCYSLIR